MNVARAYVCALSPHHEENGYLAAQLAEYFSRNGVRLARTLCTADCIVLTGYACCQEDLDSLLTRVRQLRREYRRQAIVVCGRAVDMDPRLRRLPGVCAISPRDLDRFDELFGARIKVASVRPASIGRRFFPLAGTDSAWIRIAQGCLHACSYCMLSRHARQVRSVPLPEVLRQVKGCVREGKKRLVLLADDCGSYGADIGCDTADLLQALAHLPELRGSRSRVYLNAFEPGRLLKLFPRMKEALAAGIIGHMDIDIQSGSDRLVAQMNRRYKVAQVLETVSQIRELAPRTTLSTEMIFALPGETRREFAQSIQAALHFNDALFLKYSPCPGTPMADRTGRLDEDEVGYRIAVLKKLAVTTGYRCVYHL
jgi:tRNA A37 methylthiotransferase MiaB